MKEGLKVFWHQEKADHLDVSQKIIAIFLKRYGLSYKSNVVGQAYNGASVMSGKHSGVQTSIKEAAKQALRPIEVTA